MGLTCNCKLKYKRVWVGLGFLGYLLFLVGLGLFPTKFDSRNAKNASEAEQQTPTIVNSIILDQHVLQRLITNLSSSPQINNDYPEILNNLHESTLMSNNSSVKMKLDVEQNTTTTTNRFQDEGLMTSTRSTLANLTYLYADDILVEKNKSQNDRMKTNERPHKLSSDATEKSESHKFPNSTTLRKTDRSMTKLANSTAETDKEASKSQSKLLPFFTTNSARGPIKIEPKVPPYFGIKDRPSVPHIHLKNEIVGKIIPTSGSGLNEKKRN